MRVAEFRRILQEFSKQTRAGSVITEQAERGNIADLAEQLNQKLGLAEGRHLVKSDTTISLSPSGCPCCGKS